MEFLIIPILAGLIFYAFNRKARQELSSDVNYFVKGKVQCPECLASIPKEAKKCMHCGSAQR